MTPDDDVDDQDEDTEDVNELTVCFTLEGWLVHAWQEMPPSVPPERLQQAQQRGQELDQDDIDDMALSIDQLAKKLLKDHIRQNAP